MQPGLSDHAILSYTVVYVHGIPPWHEDYSLCTGCALSMACSILTEPGMHHITASTADHEPVQCAISSVEQCMIEDMDQ